MKQKLKYLNISILVIVLVGLLVTPAFAQGGQNVISAQVDRNAVTTDDMLTLTVVINANAMNAPQPTIPNMAGFNMMGTSTSSQISIVNGSMSSSLTYSYRLQPNQVGQLVIDPITVVLEGQTYSTEPITVQVTQGNGAPSPQTMPGQSANPTAPTSSTFEGQNAFIEAEVSNPNPYLGEQINYTFRFYQANDMFDFFDQPHYTPPSFAGFWSEDNQTEQKNYRVQSAGKIYSVTELQTTLFPSKVGEITIDPAQLSIPGSFFRSGAELYTEPVVVNVRQLPANAPASFTGAVGQFELSASVDTTESKVNEPITWNVSLTGAGNINAVPDPTWPEIDGWRSFESQATINAQTQDGVMGGSKVYERLLVPGQPGQFTVPALEYSYFDPSTEEYKTLSTLTIPVNIAPGDGTASSYAPSVEAVQANGEQNANDIRHLKPAPAQLNATSNPITDSPLYWVAWIIPLVGLVGFTGWQRREQYWQNNAGLARSSKAHKKAKLALKEAQKKQGDTYQESYQILVDYLADKLNQPVAGLTRRALNELLTQKGLDTGLIERVQSCLTDAELGRFSPNAGHPDHAGNLLREVDILINDLEQSF
jgi:hypothetical protein